MYRDFLLGRVFDSGKKNPQRATEKRFKKKSNNLMSDVADQSSGTKDSWLRLFTSSVTACAVCVFVLTFGRDVSLELPVLWRQSNPFTPWVAIVTCLVVLIFSSSASYDHCSHTIWSHKEIELLVCVVRFYLCDTHNMTSCSSANPT